MSKLSEFSDEALHAEVVRRNPPRCRCGKWSAYMGIYDADGFMLRCHGCLRAVGKCTCG